MAVFDVGKKESWHLTVAAAFAAMFFALHPLRVEVVAMATDRKDSLVTFFFPLHHLGLPARPD